MLLCTKIACVPIARELTTDPIMRTTKSGLPRSVVGLISSATWAAVVAGVVFTASSVREAGAQPVEPAPAAPAPAPANAAAPPPANPPTPTEASANPLAASQLDQIRQMI